MCHSAFTNRTDVPMFRKQLVLCGKNNPPFLKLTFSNDMKTTRKCPDRGILRRYFHITQKLPYFCK